MLLSLSFILPVFLVPLVAASPNPQPTPAPQVSRKLHQVNRGELVAKAKYPEFFFKRDDAEPSATTTTAACDYGVTARSVPTESAEYLKARGVGRIADSVVEQVLDPVEMASFLLGGGSFIAPNGTSYSDPEFMHQHKRALEKANLKSDRHWIHKVVRDSLGNRLLEVSLPIYREWKRRFSGDDIIYITPSTVIRSKDMPALERALLDNPGFEEFWVQGTRVTRRYIEAAVAYGP